MTWWADSTMEHASQHLHANGTKRGPKSDVLNITIKLISQRRNVPFFLRYLVVTHKDASNNTVKYLEIRLCLVPFACKCCASMFHCAIGPPGHTANTFSQE